MFNPFGFLLKDISKAERFIGINDLAKLAHKNAVDKGWWDTIRPFPEQVVLMHSELSEAIEDYRDAKGLKDIYFEGEKPCGIPIELADCIIRILDTCGHYGIDIEEAILMKMAYNRTRKKRHGGKII